MDKAQLLAKCQAGDELALEQLVHEYQPLLFRLAFSILDDGSVVGDADAAEITQDALIKALRSLDAYRGEASLSTWLYAITVNLCRNQLRARKRRQRMRQIFEKLTTPIDDLPKPPEELVIKKETDSKIMQAVNALNTKHRIPVILRYYHNCSVVEIAQILDIPEGTVHSRLNTARKKMRNCLQKEKI